jgi:ATP-dependent DNA helicase RecQ
MESALGVLKQYWGYDSFRGLQGAIVESVYSGCDTLALLPTGGGKSICFQVPGLLMEGVCIVISPLIALMKDQVENLTKRGISAVAIHSGLHRRDVDRLLDNCVYGKVKFLYVSPERLLTDIFVARVQRMKVAMVAVDEAHCISHWGYDFRPPYLRIAELRRLLPDVPVLALTATATPEVANDIQQRLAFRAGHRLFRDRFSRPNLAYVVMYEENKLGKLLDILQKVPGTAVVYVSNRKKTRDIALWLQQHGMSADFYHAGLDNETRSKKQDDWVQDRTRIVVATNAFGMGIDKPNVRVVVHIDLPESPEAYFQEAGRAGRDGKKAYSVALYNDSDRRQLEAMHEATFPDMATVRKVYAALANQYQLAVGSGEGESYEFDLVEFARHNSFDVAQTNHALRVLQQADWITLSEAVFTPSAVCFEMNREALYDYQLKNKMLEPLIKLLLRSYQGIASNLTSVHERQLAFALKTTPEAIQQALQKMEREGVLTYQLQSDKPTLLFNQPRVPIAALSIDQQQYKFRKDRHRARLDSMLRYVTAERCRSQLLLHYFGEKDAPLCGICDICTGRHKKEVTDEEFKQIKSSLTTLLGSSSMTLTEVVGKFPPAKSEKVLQVIQYLLENEHLVMQAGEKLQWHQ